MSEGKLQIRKRKTVTKLEPAPLPPPPIWEASDFHDDRLINAILNVADLKGTELRVLRDLADSMRDRAKQARFDRSLRAELIDAAADDLEQEQVVHTETIKERDHLLQDLHETKALLLTTGANLAIAVTALNQIAQTRPGLGIGSEADRKLARKLAQHCLDEIRKKVIE